VLNYINARKTGMLIKASLKMGAKASGADAKRIKAMEKFGGYIGEAFQIVDDILDKGDSVKVLGKKESEKRVKRLTDMANNSLSIFKSRARVLSEIADYLISREF
jgi:geranylgeranyl diphosphate synthase, type II